MPPSSPGKLLSLAVLALLIGMRGASAQNAKAEAPIPAATLAAMTAKGTSPAAPVLFRAYKKEAEIEVWKKGPGGRFVYVKTFPICRWSGQLGPKRKNGDRQTPEGFYSVAKAQMNPNSHYYLSFDVGYPNAYDKAHGSTGSAVMVHGICSSMGCYAMTDEAAGEIYAIAREALAGGQAAFQFQSYPFHMSAANMARHRTDPNIAFWRQLKEGSDRFEAAGEELAVRVDAGRYAFAPSKDAGRETAVAVRRAAEDAKVAALVNEGAAAVRTTYSDGGQNAFWAAFSARGGSLGEVSRPEALAYAGQEVVLIPARRAPPPVPEAVWALWIAPTSTLSPFRTAGFAAEYERAPARFAPLVMRYAETLPAILRASLDGAAPAPAMTAGSSPRALVAQR